MNVRDLSAALSLLDPNLPVEIATSPEKDEWYEIFNVETATNFRGNDVVVINTE